MLAGRSTDSHKATVAGHPYVRGLLISLTNPKIMLFYVAVLPQFSGDAQNAGLQFAMLGAVNVAMEVILYGGIEIIAGIFNVRFRGSSKGAVTLSYIAGSMYMVLAGVAVADVLGGGILS
ncbi:LysE family translocator [Nesterenkonia populi]|uniref:LysE family translocator n=1 Tax=Nesterenkonia populi TaxID=1591087 RepID=UPI0011BFCC74|nr:LysE family transporter [Nesterenkonia populi]